MKYNQFIEILRVKLPDIELSFDVSSRSYDTIHINWYAFTVNGYYKGSIPVSAETMIDPNIDAWEIVIMQVVKVVESMEKERVEVNLD